MRGFPAVALIALVVLIAGCVGQGGGGLCPPAGLPQPPGCEGGKPVAQAGPNDFGCFPPSCSLIPDEKGRQLCEDFRAGRPITWPSDCNTLPTDACRKLCESEVTRPLNVTLESANVTLESAITVPTDLSQIDYPSFYQQARPAAAVTQDPYCIVTAPSVTYPASYLGSYDLPAVSGAPLPAAIRRAVGVKDSWGSDPNLNSCPSPDMFGAYQKTLLRAKALGAQQVHFTNYVHFADFQAPRLETDKPAVDDATLSRIIRAAREQGLGFVLYLNLAPGSVKVSEPPSGEWYGRLIDAYEPFLLSQARLAEEAGATDLMINHFDYQPSIRGFEDIYAPKMAALMKKVRSVYSGKLVLLVEPFSDTDLDKLAPVLEEADALLYTPRTSVLDGAADKTVSVVNLRSLYLRDLEQLGKDYGRFNKPFYLRVLIQSERDFLLKGWNEDAFCIARGDDPCYQKSLVVDFSSQAIAYEALLEAIKEAHGKYLDIGAVDTYGYWYTDTMLPKHSQPQMAQSIRNKPAESIVKAWFGR